MDLSHTLSLIHVPRLSSLARACLVSRADVTLSYMHMDTFTGHQTLLWLEEAHALAGVTRMRERSTVAEIATYLEDDLASVTSKLMQACPNCEVGITAKRQDLTRLSLADFVCSDFSSEEHSTDFPSRDCPARDEEWALYPRSTSAPCCRNATLVRASIVMMGEAVLYDTVHESFDVLLAGGRDPSFSSSELFVREQVEKQHFILQVRPHSRGYTAAAGTQQGKQRSSSPKAIHHAPRARRTPRSAPSLRSQLGRS